MRFSYVKKKVWTIGPVRQQKLANKRGLVNFLDAADQLHIFIGVLLEQVRRGERQDYQGLLGSKHVDAPGNGDSVYFAGAGFFKVGHAIVLVFLALAGRLNILDGLAQLLIEFLHRSIESVLVWNPKHDLNAIVGRRDCYHFAVGFCLPSLRYFELNTCIFVGENVAVLRSVWG